ncbi:hypothetical protein [Actinomadura chokoriensis]|uniref:Uncharacterized protein n=1 Tax=Actinomadura chokoriensis TaxID=454156 RepID=A0ABV4QTK4_9ACTN
MTSLVTTAEEVLSMFKVTNRARVEFESWTTSSKRKDTVVPDVLAHRTRFLYEIRPEDIERIRDLDDKDEHALGEIKRTAGESVRRIVDWDPDYAFVHTFHYILETTGHVPTWQEFRRHCYFDLRARAMLWDPAQELRNELEAEYSRVQTYQAMRWRVGNYYYSVLRELHVIAVLREQGIDVRFHPLADALFRVDAWYERTAISLYIGNPEYKQVGAAGRKPLAEQILGGASPSFTFETIELPSRDRFGSVWLVPRSDIRKVGARLLRSNG